MRSLLVFHLFLGLASAARIAEHGLSRVAPIKVDFGAKPSKGKFWKAPVARMPGFHRLEGAVTGAKLPSGVKVSVIGAQTYSYPGSQALFTDALMCGKECDMRVTLSDVPQGDYTLTLYHFAPRNLCGKCFPVVVGTSEGSVLRWSRSHARGNGKGDDIHDGRVSTTFVHAKVGADRQLQINMTHNGKGHHLGTSKDFWDHHECSHCMNCKRCGSSSGHMTLNGLELMPSLALPERKYDEADAKKYVNFAQAAFCKKEALVKWNCGQACEVNKAVAGSVRYFGPGKQCAVVGYVALREPKKCVVAFRGSVHWKNWRADLKFVPTKWPTDSNGQEHCDGCKAQVGFVEAWDELEEEVFAALKELGCTETAVTGHSLGGAVASVASFRIRTKLQLQTFPVYSFGSPRLGNGAWVQAYTRAAWQQGVHPPAWRVVHYRDPVPHLFFSEESAKYDHLPREVWYNKDFSSYTECGMEMLEDRNCSMSKIIDAFHTEEHLTYLGSAFDEDLLPKGCL